jgi:hypothetical protein
MFLGWERRDTQELSPTPGKVDECRIQRWRQGIARVRVQRRGCLPRGTIHSDIIVPLEGFDGRTPAEAAGIKVEGADKWATLIRNAASNRKFTEGVGN